MKVIHNLLRVMMLIVLIGVMDATTNARKSQIRYMNSMPQFGKAKFSAYTPQTVVFDQVPQGYITDYSTIDAQNWNFTTQYSTNVTAKSDETDLESNSYATVFTCQTGERKLKNKLIYDTARSSGPRVALLRIVNLAQFDYPINVYNGSTELVSDLSYCTASAYQEVPPGYYDFSWTTADKKRAVEGNSTGGGPVYGGKSYTLYTSPSGSLLVADATKKTARSVRSPPAEKVEAVEDTNTSATTTTTTTNDAKEVAPPAARANAKNSKVRRSKSNRSLKKSK